MNSHTVNLFEMLGLTRHVQIAKDESEALSWVEPQAKAVSEARP